jgi:hypothetical protein
MKLKILEHTTKIVFHLTHELSGYKSGFPAFKRLFIQVAPGVGEVFQNNQHLPSIKFGRF